MSVYINRSSRPAKGKDYTITVDTVLADSDAIDFRDSLYGQIHVPNGSSLTTLTFHTAPHPEETFEAAYDTSNAAVTMTVAADRSYPIPSDLQGAGAIKITGNADGTVEMNVKG